MKTYGGPRPQDGCVCPLCARLRANLREGEELDLAQADTLPPAETTKQQTTYWLERLQDELRRRGI